MDSNWQIIDHLEISSLWKNQTGFLPGFICVSTTVWLHHVCSNETLWEKAKWDHTRILRAILNKSRKQQPVKWHLYGNLPPISQVLHMDAPVWADQ